MFLVEVVFKVELMNTGLEMVDFMFYVGMLLDDFILFMFPFF